jgi:hypothetical protein
MQNKKYLNRGKPGDSWRGTGFQSYPRSGGGALINKIHPNWLHVFTKTKKNRHMDLTWTGPKAFASGAGLSRRYSWLEAACQGPGGV